MLLFEASLLRLSRVPCGRRSEDDCWPEVAKVSISSGRCMNPASPVSSEVPSLLKRRSRATMKICQLDETCRYVTQTYRFETVIRVNGPFLDHEAGVSLL